METTRQAPVNDTSVASVLYMALELSASKWRIGLADGKRSASQHTVAAGDLAALLRVIDKAKKRCRLSAAVRVTSCYEAGRDGFWLHRWLLEQGIHNLVVDSSSIEVKRRARRAKSDGLDVAKLYTMLLRFAAGEKDVWQVLRVPSVEQEDARRVHRELERLKRERTGHANRIGSLLVLHNVRVQRVGGRGWSALLEKLKAQLPSALWAEIARESEREHLVAQQIAAVEKSRREQLKAISQQGGPLVALHRLRGIGLQGAWVLVHELFGWREFGNRRQLASCVGLTPSPYDSGDTQREQGISKAGNRRCRTLLVELAWYWLRYQPHSALSEWFNRRFAAGASACDASALWPWRAACSLPCGAMLSTGSSLPGRS
jgi:transposase